MQAGYARMMRVCKDNYKLRVGACALASCIYNVCARVVLLRHPHNLYAMPLPSARRLLVVTNNIHSNQFVLCTLLILLPVVCLTQNDIIKGTCTEAYVSHMYSVMHGRRGQGGD
jgi:hypothetical protein